MGCSASSSSSVDIPAAEELRDKTTSQRAPGRTNWPAAPPPPLVPASVPIPRPAAAPHPTPWRIESEVADEEEMAAAQAAGGTRRSQVARREVRRAFLREHVTMAVAAPLAALCVAYMRAETDVCRQDLDAVEPGEIDDDDGDARVDDAPVNVGADAATDRVASARECVCDTRCASCSQLRQCVARSDVDGAQSRDRAATRGWAFIAGDPGSGRRWLCGACERQRRLDQARLETSRRASRFVEQRRRRYAAEPIATGGQREALRTAAASDRAFRRNRYAFHEREIENFKRLAVEHKQRPPTRIDRRRDTIRAKEAGSDVREFATDPIFGACSNDTRHRDGRANERR